MNREKHFVRAGLSSHEGLDFPVGLAMLATEHPVSRWPGPANRAQLLSGHSRERPSAFISAGLDWTPLGNPGSPPQSRSLPSFHLQNPFASDATQSQVPGFRTWASWGAGGASLGHYFSNNISLFLDFSSV